MSLCFVVSVQNFSCLDGCYMCARLFPLFAPLSYLFQIKKLEAINRAITDGSHKIATKYQWFIFLLNPSPEYPVFYSCIQAGQRRGSTKI